MNRLFTTLESLSTTSTSLSSWYLSERESEVAPG